MTDQRTDQGHAAAVKAAANTLNAAIDAAADAGLQIELRVDELQNIGEVKPRPVISANIARPL